MGTIHAEGSGRASEVEEVSLILAKSINSQLGVCGERFSETVFALCLAPYVEYASAWLKKFTRDRIAGALPGISLNISALCQFSAKSLFETETKIVDQPVRFVESFGLGQEFLDFYREEIEELGCERAQGVVEGESSAPSLFAKFKDRVYSVIVSLAMPKRGGVVFLDAISRWAALALTVHSWRPVVLLLRGSEVEHEVDVGLRLRLAESLRANSALSERQSIIATVGLALTSAGLLEGIHASLGEAETIGKFEPRAVVFCLAPFYRPADLIWIALQKARGSLVYGMQHGGYYGEGITSPLHESEKRISNRYLTYGWSYREADIPIDSIRLSRSLPRHVSRRVPGSVLLVLENITALQDFDRDVRRSSEISAKMRTIGTVLAEMGEQGAIGAVTVRFHPFNRCQYQIDAVKCFLPFANLTGAASGSLSEHTQRAEVCLFDSMGSTGALECLSQGTPIVVFEPEFRKRVCLGARAFYESLASARLVATDVETLRAGIKAGLEFAHGTSNSDYKAAFLEYRQRHARASRGWIASLGRLLRSV